MHIAQASEILFDDLDEFVRHDTQTSTPGDP
jgi:hypothetical protein